MTYHTPNSGRSASQRYFSGDRLRRSLGTVFSTLFALALAIAASNTSAFAQSATGSISGRVYNPATGEYVANAEVKLADGSASTTTDATGNYRLDRVPAGTANVAVNFIGYQTTTVAVAVTAGETTAKDLDLLRNAPQSADSSKDNKIITLEAFSVAAEREGNAKAIMAQRNSMNISNSVSADVFGTTSEGNVGEFLKYLPGVDLEYVEADTRTPRLGALDPSYTGVTLNGMGMASADAFQQANGTDNVRAGGGNRSFGFEQVSINSIESIEINQTTAADQDASSPAGTINLKTKKAFDRKERYIGYSVVGMTNSEDSTLKRTFGPGDAQAYKIKPGASLDYYDSFLNHRFGVVFNLSESNMYNQQRLVQLGYNTTPTATDTRPFVLNSLTFKSGPKFTERFSASLGMDFKATKDLTLSWVSGYQWYSAQYYNRQVAVTANSRANVTGDGLTSFDIINDGATYAYAGAQASKLTRSFQLAPSFEYKKGAFNLTGAVNYSTSTNSYGAVARRKNTRDVPVNSVGAIDFHISRSEPEDVDFTVRQTVGGAASGAANKDVSNFANFTNPRVVDDGRYNRKNIYQGQLDGKYTFNWILPIIVKTGGKITETSNANDDYTPIYTWAYTGPGGGSTGSWANYLSPTPFDMGSPSVNFVNLAGNTFNVPFTNRQAVANLFYDHPEYFSNNSTAANWYTAVVGNHRRIREQVNAGYLMATTKFRSMSFQAGLRDEQTVVTSREFDPRTKAEVVAAGFTTDTTGRATTVPGLAYQYLSQPQISRSGRYNNLFPSASFKWNVMPNMAFQGGYTHAIRRPNYNDIGGVVTIDENALTINVPNQDLKPEISDNIAARLAYYFTDSVGNIAISAAQNKLKDTVATTAYKSEDTIYGVEFPNYTVFTKSTLGGSKTVKNLTIDYRQTIQIPYIRNYLNAVTVFGNFTRNVVDNVAKYGVPPLMASGGISTGYKRFGVGLKAKWTDDTPWNFVEGRFRKERIMTDLDLSYNISKQFNLFVSGRNITNEADYVYDGGNRNYIQKVEHYGTVWTFGVNGRY